MILNTSLVFNGDCRQAFNFYAKVLGGEIKAMISVGDMQMPGTDALPKDMIMHAWMEVRGQTLMGGDAMPDKRPRDRIGFDVAVHFDDPEESHRVFAALAEGGQVLMPIGPSPWSPAFGSLIDQFGVPWMVNTNPPAQ